MLKKTVQYEDFNGEAQTEDLYFNLSQAELTKMQLSFPGGFGEHLKTVGESNDGALIMKTFDDLLKASYGKRSPDGAKFIKTQEVWDDFISSAAYSEFYMGLMTSTEEQIAFVKGVMPKELAEAAAKAVADNNPAPVQLPTQEVRLLTIEQARDLDLDELNSGLATGKYRITA